MFKVNSKNVTYSKDKIHSKYVYRSTKVSSIDNQITVTPTETNYEFIVNTNVKKLGLMMVGWGGNNGSTLTASIIANRDSISWNTKEGLQTPNYYGSLTQSSTLHLGQDDQGNEVNIPFNKILPMADPNDFVLGGWDISKLNLNDAMKRAKVLEYDLQRQLADKMMTFTPLPSVYSKDFIALNQSDRFVKFKNIQLKLIRADNLIPGTMQEQLDQIRKDIRDFKKSNNIEKVIVLWTANTERYADIIKGVNDNSANILSSIQKGHSEIAPSSLFAVASILENTPFINGSPQNTFVPGVMDLAAEKNVYIGGDDFKSGQTKIKSVLVDFLVNAGIKPLSITSYNHLGNNDGKNLDEHKQFLSKEISKSSVVDDMVAANPILYKEGEHPDHIVVIKYCPSVGDSKRALDEYVSEIFMGGRNTLSIYNVCEDSLLASPLIIDLAIITDLMTRIEYRTSEKDEFKPFHSVLSLLSYMLKAPLVPTGTSVINALGKQRAALVNIFRACVGLDPVSDMRLETRI